MSILSRFRRMRYVTHRSGMALGAPILLSAVLALSACSLSDLVSTTLPSTATDPATLETPQGAVDRYKAAIMRFRTVYSGYNTGNVFIQTVGLLSDELGSGQYNTLASGNYSALSVVDSRNMSSSAGIIVADGVTNGVWSGLSATRINAQDGIFALARFAPDAPSDLTGHVYVLQGMAEVALAELFCSGIPLAKLLPGGGFEYGAGLSSDKVFEHAVAQFDTAMSLIRDSANFLNFARVAKGRALLNLGRYEEAATAVSEVPVAFKYQNYHSITPAGAIGVANFMQAGAGNYGIMVDREGTNGLDFISANDPRVVANDTSFVMTAYPETNVILPRKWFAPNGATPVTVADGIEARLIEAEADLKAGRPGWLGKLNALRTTCDTIGTCATPAPAGTGGVANLPPLKDPGTASKRVDLLFRERAFWLYLTGHRVGDMRRLIRQYGRTAAQVFPVGAYPSGPDGSYGIEINMPAPKSELDNNPKYTGCINREA